MSLSAALEEFYASGGEDEIAIVTVEIVHVGLPEPIRWVTGIEATDGDETATIQLPLVEGGVKVPFRLCAFRIVRPGMDRDGPTDGKLQLDGVSGELQEPLTAAQGYGAPLKVTFRTYLVASRAELNAVTGPDEVIDTLELSSVAVTADMAEGTLTLPDGRGLNVPTGPNAFFDRSNYPGLFT